MGTSFSTGGCTSKATSRHRRCTSALPGPSRRLGSPGRIADRKRGRWALRGLCAGRAVQLSKHCYAYVKATTALTFMAAQKHCNTWGGYLVTLGEAAEELLVNGAHGVNRVPTSTTPPPSLALMFNFECTGGTETIRYSGYSYSCNAQNPPLSTAASKGVPRWRPRSAGPPPSCLAHPTSPGHLPRAVCTQSTSAIYNGYKIINTPTSAETGSVSSTKSPTRTGSGSRGRPSSPRQGPFISTGTWASRSGWPP